MPQSRGASARAAALEPALDILVGAMVPVPQVEDHRLLIARGRTLGHCRRNFAEQRSLSFDESLNIRLHVRLHIRLAPRIKRLPRGAFDLLLCVVASETNRHAVVPAIERPNPHRVG